MRGVIAARAEERVALYTGNDDHIVLDLVTPFDADARRRAGDGALSRRPARPLVGVDEGRGRAARALQGERGRAGRRRGAVDRELLALDSRVTDCNSAFFDVANDFRGCIAGCHEVLRRQGLLEGIWCLDPGEGLSPGQREAIDRVCREHADLADDAFVAAHLRRAGSTERRRRQRTRR